MSKVSDLDVVQMRWKCAVTAILRSIIRTINIYRRQEEATLSGTSRLLDYGAYFMSKIFVAKVMGRLCAKKMKL